MSRYNWTAGRFETWIGDEGKKNHDYGHGGQVMYRDGWNDSCPMITVYLSISEMHDLRYVLDRAIKEAEGSK